MIENSQRHRPLLTVAEVADWLSVSVRWVYANADLLPVVRVGRQLRFRGEDIERWVARPVTGGTGERGVG